jgi:hypothetical protein
MEQKDLNELVNLADKLDVEGHAEEAAALDTVLKKYAAEAAEKAEMSNKAVNALKSMLRTLKSFCGKNLDSRGPKRRQLNKICDLAEDLMAEIKGIVGDEE